VNGEWLMGEVDDVDDVAPLTVNHLRFTINHLPFTINHLPFTINHLPFTVNHLPFTIIPRGELDIKGKGLMNTYFLTKTNE